MDLVGLSEVAEMAGVSRQAVVNWRARFSDFPAPSAELASGPVWVKEDIEKWLKIREGNMESVITGVTGSGKPEAKEMDLSDFDHVELANAIQAEITRSDKFSVKVTVDDNLFHYVDISKSGNTLRVRMRPRISFWHVTALVTITMPDLRGLKVTGASRASVSGFNSSNPLDMHASGASKIALQNVKAGETRIQADGASRVTGSLDMADGRMEASGASTIQLEGHGGSIRVEANGASSARLGDFSATDADIRLSGASNAIVNLKGKLDADISGVSHLTYGGEVSLGKLQVTGASSLRKK